MKRDFWDWDVSEEFQIKAIDIAFRLGINPDYLMACMAFETGETFSPSIRNAAGSGAVGLIQFMPSTAASLGTSTEELEAMTVVEQLDFVEKYFTPWKGRLKSLEDVYMAILWPGAIGKGPDHVLFRKNDKKHPKRYLQNAGLDFDKNGEITVKEATEKVRKILLKGMI